MAQENYWSNPDSLAARLRNAANYNRGYNATPPTYNMNLGSIPQQRLFNPDEIQNSVNNWWANRQTPQVTQTFTMPQYIQTADYNGQPVRVPRNASDEVAGYAPDVAKWLAGQAVQNMAIRGLTGNSLGGWAGYYVPRAAGVIAGSQFVNSMPFMTKAVDAGRQLVNTPTAQKLGNGIKNAINWIL